MELQGRLPSLPSSAAFLSARPSSVLLPTPPLQSSTLAVKCCCRGGRPQDQEGGGPVPVNFLTDRPAAIPNCLFCARASIMRRFQRPKTHCASSCSNQAQFGGAPKSHATRFIDVSPSMCLILPDGVVCAPDRPTDRHASSRTKDPICHRRTYNVGPAPKSVTMRGRRVAS